MYSSEPLPHFIDDYLAFLHEVLPTTAAFDGVHTHDDLLEDYSRSAIDSLLRDLGAFGRRLGAINPETLTASQRLERPVVDAHIRAKVHEFEQKAEKLKVSIGSELKQVGAGLKHVGDDLKHVGKDLEHAGTTLKGELVRLRDRLAKG